MATTHSATLSQRESDAFRGDEPLNRLGQLRAAVAALLIIGWVSLAAAAELLPTLEKVDNLRLEGDTAAAAQLAQEYVRTLPAQQELPCTLVGELRFLAATLVPSEPAQSGPDAALHAQSTRCGDRLLARQLDWETAQLLQAGKFAPAHQSALRALAQWERAAPKSLAHGHALNIAAILAIRLSNPKQGLRHAQAALDIVQLHGGAQSIAEQRAKSNLASLYWIDRQELRAEKLFLQALAVTQKIRGPEHRDVARLLMNLGGLYSWLNDHQRAREMLQRALDIANRPASAMEKDERLRASAMLAEQYAASGRLGRALALFESSLQQREADFAPNDDRTRALRRNIARLYLNLQQFERAVELSREELQLLREEQRSETTDAAWMLDTLAQARLLASATDPTGKPEALDLAKQALALRRRDDKANSTASALLTLARAQLGNEAHAGAALSLRAFEREFGASANADFLRAQLAAVQHRTTDAIALALTVENQERERLRRQLRGFSESDAIALTTTRPDGLSLAISLALTDPSTVNPFAIWQQVAARRGLVFSERQQRQVAVLNNRHPQQRAAWNRWIAANRALSAASTSANAAEVDTARRTLQQAETALSASVGDTHLKVPELPHLGWLQPLPTTSRVLSFVRFTQSLQPSVDGAAKAHYAVLVVAPDGATQLLDLGAAETVDSAVANWRALISRPSKTPSEYARTIAAGSAVTALVWQPIAALVAEASHLFLIPTGSLYDVHFAALPMLQGSSATPRFLVETEPLMVNLNQESELIARAKSTGKGALLLGDIDFGAHRSSSSITPCGSLAHLRFDPLPASGAEIIALAALWPAHLGPAVTLTGTAANKSTLRSLTSGKRVVHLATHGFFLDECDQIAALEPRQPQLADARGVGGLSPPGSQPTAPMLLLDALDEPAAGIALAGANLRDPLTWQSQGILSLNEAASLDLRQADWVAVSACDSGRSSPRSWEGSFGLRRALAMAGARTTIMSGWAVADSAARDFMVALYRARYVDQKPTAVAIRTVQRANLAALRRANSTPDPYRWANFIAIGDWR